MLISTIVFKVCLAGYEFSLLDWLLCFDLVCFRLLDACHRLGLLVGYSMIHWLSRYQFSRDHSGLLVDVCLLVTSMIHWLSRYQFVVRVRWSYRRLSELLLVLLTDSSQLLLSLCVFNSNRVPCSCSDCHCLLLDW